MANGQRSRAGDGLRTFHYICLVLVIIGAINWGLVGAFAFDLVAAIFGPGSGASRLVYVLVGLAGIGVALTTAMLAKPAPWSRTISTTTP